MVPGRGLQRHLQRQLGALGAATSEPSACSSAPSSSVPSRLVIAVPVSVGIALFVTEVAHRRGPSADRVHDRPPRGDPVRGVRPLGPPGPRGAARRRLPSVSRRLVGRPDPRSPTANPNPSGASFMTAGIVVAIMITPIITAITREVYATCPPAQKEAALALGRDPLGDDPGRGVPPQPQRRHRRGDHRLRARAVGETIAVALVIGSSPRLTAEIFGPGDTMASVIVNSFGEATGHLAVRAHRARRRAPRGDRRHRGPRPDRPGPQATSARGGVMTTIAPPPRQRRPGPTPSTGPGAATAAARSGTGRDGPHLRIVRRRSGPAVSSSCSSSSRRAAASFGWHFLTTDIPISDRDFGGGMKPAVVGTLLITGAATAMAVPLGVLGASTSTSTASRGPWAG